MSNPVRTCLGCGVEDDHPRHVVAVDPLNDVPWHHDCHAAITKCELCVAITKAAKGKTGDALRTYIMKGE
jgi:hypothetical protein